MNPPPYPIFLDVADDAQSWQSVGFTVDSDGIIRIGELSIRLIGRLANDNDDAGIVGWGFYGLPDDVVSLHGIPVIPAGVCDRYNAGSLNTAQTTHPNGVYEIDHLVVLTDDWQRGVEDFRKVEGTPPSGTPPP